MIRSKEKGRGGGGGGGGGDRRNPIKKPIEKQSRKKAVMASELQKKKMFIENQYAHFSLQCEVMEKMGRSYYWGKT